MINLKSGLNIQPSTLPLFSTNNKTASIIDQQQNPPVFKTTGYRPTTKLPVQYYRPTTKLPVLSTNNKTACIIDQQQNCLYYQPTTKPTNNKTTCYL
jgi:hypothetical protein